MRPPHLRVRRVDLSCQVRFACLVEWAHPKGPVHRVGATERLVPAPRRDARMLRHYLSHSGRMMVKQQEPSHPPPPPSYGRPSTSAPELVGPRTPPSAAPMSPSAKRRRRTPRRSKRVRHGGTLMPHRHYDLCSSPSRTTPAPSPAACVARRAACDVTCSGRSGSRRRWPGKRFATTSTSARTPVKRGTSARWRCCGASRRNRTNASRRFAEPSSTT
jgi:hypothetical protein